MGNTRFPKEIWDGLNSDEILEIRKKDVFILLMTARSFLKLGGSTDVEIAKILAVMFCENKWKERIADEFVEFAKLMGESYEEDNKVN